MIQDQWWRVKHDPLENFNFKKINRSRWTIKKISTS